jgi:hypothetical protein
MIPMTPLQSWAFLALLLMLVLGLVRLFAQPRQDDAGTADHDGHGHAADGTGHDATHETNVIDLASRMSASIPNPVRQEPILRVVKGGLAERPRYTVPPVYDWAEHGL